MIQITLGANKYTVPMITGRAMREMGSMDELYKRADKGEEMPLEDMDTAVQWLCLLFRNQFAPDEVYDGYPVDRFWIDIFSFYFAVKRGLTEKLKEFPTPPETEEKKAVG